MTLQRATRVTGPPHLGVLRLRRVAGRGASWAVLAAFMVFFGGPLVWLLLAPTRSDDQQLADHPFGFGSAGNVKTAFSHLGDYSINQRWELGHWALNSVIYSVAGVALVCFLCIPAGYALAVYRFPGRRLILIATLIGMIMPVAALVLPQFLLLHKLGLLNTRLAVILPAALYPFGTFLAFIYFSTTLTRDLLGAARIDGCSEAQVFIYIAAPLAKSVIAVIAFFSFIANWNNYFLPSIVLSSNSLYPLQVGLVQIASDTFAMTPLGGSQNIYPIHKPELALATLLIVAPIILFFLFSQRFVRQGMLAGSRKE